MYVLEKNTGHFQIYYLFIRLKKTNYVIMQQII